MSRHSPAFRGCGLILAAGSVFRHVAEGGKFQVILRWKSTAATFASSSASVLSWKTRRGLDPVAGGLARWSSARTRRYRDRSNADCWRYPALPCTGGQPLATFPWSLPIAVPPAVYIVITWLRHVRSAGGAAWPSFAPFAPGSFCRRSIPTTRTRCSAALQSVVPFETVPA